MKLFKKAINHNDSICDIYHVGVNNFSGIPDELIIKAHAVCFYNGKMVLVNHKQWDVWGIPGGTRELNESIEQTLFREIQEETNCEVVDFRPISYQKIVSQDNDIHYRVHYICNIKPIGEFNVDPAGHVCKILWIEPNDFKKYIEKKEFKEFIIQEAVNIYIKNI